MKSGFWEIERSRTVGFQQGNLCKIKGEYGSGMIVTIVVILKISETVQGNRAGKKMNAVDNQLPL